MIRVITDSTSYIPVDLLETLSMDVLSLSVVFSDVEYREDSIDNETFYRVLKEKNEIPKSSQPAYQEMYDCFEKHLEAGDDVVAVMISSKLSGTLSTANMIASELLEKYPDRQVRFVDANSTAMEMGYPAIVAGRAAKEGLSIDQVVKQAEEAVKCTRFIFMPESLEYLKMGGRIGQASALLGAVLQIKPLLTVVDGTVDVLTKVRSKKKAIQTMVNYLNEDVKAFGLSELTVHHINNLKEAEPLAEKIREELGVPVSISSIGPVVGTHVGPGAIGIAYYTEKPRK